MAMKLKELLNRIITAFIPEPSAAHALYVELSKPEYNDRSAGFYTEDRHEDMSLVHESIYGWWKPRFLMDHRAKEACEFMGRNEHFVHFTAADLDWDTSKSLVL